LGGAVGGAVLGVGVSLNHAWLRKQYESIKFMAFGEKIPRPPFWKRASTWYSGLAILSSVLMLSVLRVGFSERVFGKGILAVAQEPSEDRDVEYIAQFAGVLVHKTAETDPSRLLRGAFALHAAKNYAAAEKIYLALSILHKQRVGAPDFVSPATAGVLAGAYDAALRNVPFVHGMRGNSGGGQGAPALGSALDAAFCSQPATTFGNLGFHVLAGLLWECAFALNPSNEEMAVHVVEAYWRSERSQLLFSFLKSLEGPALPRGLELDTTEPIPPGEEI
jgi:hypothetical protein